jgi:8-oxo-dGTP diphosphatase
MNLIKKSALVVIRNNSLLTVTKRGSPDLLMPGGKLGVIESAIAALKREINEELGCSINASSIVNLGNFEDLTADGKSRVSIELFSGKLIGIPKASSEIDSLVWISADDINKPEVTPIIKNRIVPFLVVKKLLK